MKTYDAIIVLGSQPDPTTWRFPPHIYQSLDKAQELLDQGAAPCIVLSGDHALRFDNTGITQPFTEADKLEEYLLSQHCPPGAIIKERVSKDTLANYYYLKKLVFIPRGWHRFLQVTPEYRVPRLDYLSKKVLGPDYSVDFQTVDSDNVDVINHEAFIFEKQQEYLKEMSDGDDSYLSDYFYDSPWYRFWKQREQTGSSVKPDPR